MEIEPTAAHEGQVASAEPRRCLDSVHSVCNEERRDRTQDKLPTHAIKRDLSPMPISRPVFSFFTCLLPSQCSLLLCREGRPLFSRTSAGSVSVKEGGG